MSESLNENKENVTAETAAENTNTNDTVQEEAPVEIKPLQEGELLTRAQRNAWEEKAGQIIEKIRPYIQHDGGDVQLLGVDEEGIAYVTFLGACAGCMMAGEDFSTGIRLLLLDEFPELKEVVLVG
jgi:Fe-S cluster biogenesis protein NfuA